MIAANECSGVAAPHQEAIKSAIDVIGRLRAQGVQIISVAASDVAATPKSQCAEVVFIATSST
ncbi:hypothetical protein C1T17_14235 [Sphingobium sp. SCG-1]|uniref:hypothetical protein n=1 Tax=Sphingobium sp. SCG-1 TaxID=2072936 RepID=UPI000CD68F8C|nr:hypothetical protein [Sphingobium sp. SCG-1]AUW59078.1 hypothetical protein C1T17_14235 [Sphingobium sp. SCG-1]